jgi:hypothetical protein
MIPWPAPTQKGMQLFLIMMMMMMMLMAVIVFVVLADTVPEHVSVKLSLQA